MADFNFLRTWQYWSKFIIVLLLVSAGVWFGYYKWYRGYYLIYHNRPESHVIQGQINLVLGSGEALAVSGVHILDQYPQNSDFAHPQNFKVNLLESTKFVKTTASGEETGSPKDMKEHMSVIVRTNDNTIGSLVIDASEVDYSGIDFSFYSMSGKVTAVSAGQIDFDALVPSPLGSGVITEKKIILLLSTGGKFYKVTKTGQTTAASPSDIKPGVEITAYYRLDPYVTVTDTAYQIQVH